MVSTTTPFCLEIALSTVQRGEFREPEFCEHRAGLCSESREGQGLGKLFPPAEPWRTAGLQTAPGSTQRGFLSRSRSQVACMGPLVSALHVSLGILMT